MIPTDEHGDWYTIPEAATIRGITLRAMYKLIAENQHTIRTAHDGQRTYICGDDILKPRPSRAKVLRWHPTDLCPKLGKSPDEDGNPLGA